MAMVVVTATMARGRTILTRLPTITRRLLEAGDMARGHRTQCTQTTVKIEVTVETIQDLVHDSSM